MSGAREPVLGVRRVHDRDRDVYLRPDEPVTIHGFDDEEVFRCAVLKGFRYEESILALRSWIERHPTAADAETDQPTDLIRRGVE